MFHVGPVDREHVGWLSFRMSRGVPTFLADIAGFLDNFILLCSSLFLNDWAVLGACLIFFDVYWTVLVVCWKFFGAYWTVVGGCWNVLGACWKVLGACWTVLGAYLTVLCACWTVGTGFVEVTVILDREERPTMLFSPVSDEGVSCAKLFATLVTFGPGGPGGPGGLGAVFSGDLAAGVTVTDEPTLSWTSFEEGISLGDETTLFTPVITFFVGGIVLFVGTFGFGPRFTGVCSLLMLEIDIPGGATILATP